MGASAKPDADTAIRAKLPSVPDPDGFRSEVLRRAGELGLLGWVRTDDTVGRVHAEGPTEAVAAIAGYLRESPAGSGAEIEPTEPEGHEQFAIRGVSAGRFEVVPIPEGGGYELRLEVDGAMRLWRLPRSPSMDPAVKRMAFEAEGAAEVSGADAWDGGTYEQGGRVPWPEAIGRGHAVFVLHGARLTGGFALQRIRTGPRTQWLLIKRRDEHARRGGDGKS